MTRSQVETRSRTTRVRRNSAWGVRWGLTLAVVHAHGRTAAVLCLLFLTGCPERTAVWVAPGSTAKSLHFQIANKRGGTTAVGVASFSVARCTASSDGGVESTVWALDNVGSENPMLIKYGEAPTGFRTVTPARPLRPGCYSIHLSGSQRAQFEIAVDDSVREME
jgi:hypothetical protein